MKSLNVNEVGGLHPACCGMPKLEHGNIADVAKAAREVATMFKPWIENGYEVVALTPSCSLMLKFEWPLILPDDDDVRLLSSATKDISEYLVDIAKKEGLAAGMVSTLRKHCGPSFLSLTRTKGGQKAAELLRLIPDADVEVIERCSGHGGSWGMMKDNFETGLKIGRPSARKVIEKAPNMLCLSVRSPEPT